MTSFLFRVCCRGSAGHHRAGDPGRRLRGEQREAGAGGGAPGGPGPADRPRLLHLHQRRQAPAGGAGSRAEAQELWNPEFRCFINGT